MKSNKTKTIKINNYVRYWDRSETNGHNIEILKTDGSLLKIEMRWPKGENRLVKPGRAHKRLKSGKYI
tara:strand:- start:414 stop:617 length:204 start_codon:yes stop_codon:yes gene_type:complete